MNLETVISSDLCSGCGLCASLIQDRVVLEMKEPGYLRPKLTAPLDSDENRLMADVCPGSRVNLTPPGSLSASPEWGRIELSAVAHSTDADLRFRASSGGALSEFGAWLINSGAAEYVLHISADETVPWRNRSQTSLSRQEIAAGSGSRYAPSSPLLTVKEHLDSGRRFAVVGKPCDIAALRAYARHDSRVDAQIPAMLSFMCGGIPSESGVMTLIQRMGALPDKVRRFRFRGNGWPGVASAETPDKTYTLSYAQSWGGVLSKHVQRRCKICVDGNGMNADIVCADAWYGDERGYPRFDEQAGRSLVLGRTERGVGIIKNTVAAGQLALQPLDPREIDLMQPYQLQRTRLALSRILALRLLLRPATRFTGVSLLPFAARAGLAANIRSFAGTLVRIVRGRM